MAAYYNEHDPFAAAWLRELIKAGQIAPGDVDERSIEDVLPIELAGYTQCHFFAGIGVWSYALRRAGWPDARPVWTGSCPCQPFSAAGKGGGFADERHLWPAWFHLIGVRKPSIVLGEQVASKDGLGWFDLVHADMEAAGYAIGAGDLCAAGVGAPHIRQRLWFVGKRVGDTTGTRHAREVLGPERIARDEARLRLPGEGSGPDGLAHSHDTGSQGRRKPGRERADELAARSGSVAGGMADADCFGTERWTGDAGETQRFSQGQREPEHRADVSERGGADRDRRGTLRGGGVSSYAARPGPTNGHWRAADWLHCRDGKWRPVEPGTFPLAHGAPARVGRLRGYGNAINAEAAQAFIESVM
jgi:DNA (cytosine-5)-methyltransferase 1